MPRMNEYFSRFQPRYAKGTDQVLSSTVNLQLHLFMGDDDDDYEGDDQEEEE